MYRPPDDGARGTKRKKSGKRLEIRGKKREKKKWYSTTNGKEVQVYLKVYEPGGTCWLEGLMILDKIDQERGEERCGNVRRNTTSDEFGAFLSIKTTQNLLSCTFKSSSFMVICM